MHAETRAVEEAQPDSGERDALRASEARYRALATATADVIYCMGPDWQEMRELDGRGFLSDTPASGARELSRSWLERYIHPDDRARVTTAIEAAVSTRSRFALEHRVIRVDGTLGWTYSRAVPVFDAAGVLVEWIGTASDVTQRKQAELAVLASETRYRALFDAIDQGFCIIEVLFAPDGAGGECVVDYRFVETNPAFLQQTGLTNVVGQTMRTLAPAHEAHWFETYGRVALTGEAKRFEAPAAALGRWYDVYAFRVGAPLERRVAILFNDVGSRNRAEAVLRASEERQAFLLKLSDALSLLAAPEAMQAACRLLCEQLDVQRVNYAEIEGDEYVVRSSHARGVEPIAGGGKFATSAHATPEEYRPAGAIVISDVANDARLDEEQRAAYAGSSIAATASVMLIKEERWVASFAAHSFTPRRWTPLELALMRETTERVWEAVERARAEAALRASEARSRALVANLPGGAVFVVDKHLRYELAAGEAFAAAGLVEEHFVGRTVGEVLDPASAEVYTPYYLRALAGEPFEVEHSAHGRAFLTRGAPLKDGDHPAALVISVDITERRRAEAQLRASETRYRTIIENVHDYAIFLLDSHGIVTEWTAGAERVKGYTAAEAIGQHLAFFFTPEDVVAGLVERELAEAAATGRAEREGWRVRKGGERIWVNEVATAVRGEDGALRGFTKISRDLTAQKRIEDERAEVLAREQEARREAERAMILRDEFLTVISHELRTPLSSILLWSNLLRGGGMPAAQQSAALVSIETSALAQKQLIEDLLDVSSMLSGKMKLTVRDVALGPALVASVAAIQPTADIKKIRVEAHLGTGNLWASVDPDRLQQVMWNLLSNAVKFTPAGGSVSVRLVERGTLAQISVEDTGQGIAPGFLPFVFERFRQQDASITRVKGGLGLGLAIARQLVELQGGTIAAASRGEGRGATFTVELPTCVGSSTDGFDDDPLVETVAALARHVTTSPLGAR